MIDSTNCIFLLGESIIRIPGKEEGQGLVEYALLLVLAAVAVVIAPMGRTMTMVYAGLNGQTLDGAGAEYVVTGGRC